MTPAPSGRPMQDSGIPWVGSIPDHWCVKRAKFLFTLAKRPPRETDGIVTAFRDGEVTLRANRRTDGFTNAIREAGYQGVRKGDLVIHAMDAFAGAIGVSDSDGKCTPVYSCCVPNEKATSEFYAHCVRTMSTTGYIESLAKGIRERSTDFRWVTFADQLLPLPPRAEQDAIVTYLDYATTRIDTLVAKKTHFIDLLREKRHALITHAVTKGLKANVPMKDSGVEWLGMVPKHWKVMKFGYVAQVTEGLVDPRCEPYLSMPLIAPNHIESGTGRLLGTESAMDQGAISGKYFCKQGAVIYSKIRPALAKAVVAPTDCLCSADMYPLYSTERALPNWLFYLLLSKSFTSWAALESDRVAMPKINRESLSELIVAVPPISEQADVVSYIAHNTPRIDTLIAKTERSIELLGEYRTALITAAVTGKIDLQNAA